MVHLQRRSAVATLCVIFVFATCGVGRVLGGYRKCVCTSKSCRENGAKICRTRYSCYTELIYEAKSSSARTTRGCTEAATPLLCEAETSWRASIEDGGANTLQEISSRPAWPRLICCNSHDYCNAADEDFESQEQLLQATESELQVQDRPGRETGADYSTDQFLHPMRAESRLGSLVSGSSPIAVQTSEYQDAAQPLHFAALVLALAALFSVFGACYVVTSLSH